MKELHWDDLIIERRAGPAPMDDGRFRTWMSGRSVFVSSRMDEEMAGTREAVRTLLVRWGARPVMWEELTPRDQYPERAYIEGVERSSIYVLLMGRAYGAADESGYSPTHKEGLKAKDLALPRLVFEDGDVRPSERDGRLNDWLRSLYSQVSTGRYEDVDHLSRLLEDRLREIAAAQETSWIKLGNLVFPGTVSRHHESTGTEFIVRARVRENRVRTALGEITSWSSRVRADRLTWGGQTYPVTVDSVHAETAASSEDVVEVRGALPRQHGGGQAYRMGMTINGMGPAEQAEIWIRRAVLGKPEPPPSSRQFGIRAMVEPDPPFLQDVLSSYDARGPLAEGLTRLYLAEGLLHRFGGHFERLEVGPATSRGVRVSVVFTPGAHGARPVRVEGVAPFG